MGDMQFTLTASEREYLLGLLEAALGDTRVEVHRTHTPGYREQVLQQENLIRQLLGKLRKSVISDQ